MQSSLVSVHFLDAVRYKFRLDAVNFGLFYRSLLRRKLTDFLIEERRRDSAKQARLIQKENQVKPADPSIADDVDD